MAQQVEHVLGKDEVTGSNPVSSSIKKGNPSGLPFLIVLLIIETGDRVRTWFCASKTDEARRVKKTYRWYVFSQSGEQFTIATWTPVQKSPVTLTSFAIPSHTTCAPYKSG